MLLLFIPAVYAHLFNGPPGDVYRCPHLNDPKAGKKKSVEFSVPIPNLRFRSKLKPTRACMSGSFIYWGRRLAVNVIFN